MFGAKKAVVGDLVYEQDDESAEKEEKMDVDVPEAESEDEGTKFMIQIVLLSSEPL